MGIKYKGRSMEAKEQTLRGAMFKPSWSAPAPFCAWTLAPWPNANGRVLSCHVQRWFCLPVSTSYSTKVLQGKPHVLCRPGSGAPARCWARRWRRLPQKNYCRFHGSPGAVALSMACRAGLHAARHLLHSVLLVHACQNRCLSSICEVLPLLHCTNGC